MTAAAVPTPAATTAASTRRRRLLWGALITLLLVAQTLLVVLTLAFESNRAQEQVDAMAIDISAEIKRSIALATQDVQALTWDDESDPLPWPNRARAQLQRHRALGHVERRTLRMAILDAVPSPFGAPLFERYPRSSLSYEAEAACAAALRGSAPAFSPSYFAPSMDGMGREVIDLCLPRQVQGKPNGYVVATFVLGTLLEAALPSGQVQRYEISFVESDGARLVKAGAPRGVGIYRSERVVDLPGRSLLLRVDSAAGPPSLIPNLAVALVLGLSLALLALVIVLARDVRRRSMAEAALAESLAFRKAMEDSLITGLRARDLRGRITYVNPAFCAMVGYSADELRSSAEPSGNDPRDGQLPIPPYWPPEHVQTYLQRQAARLALPANGPDAASREGYETVFMRRDGDRFPVIIYEAPLVDGSGRHGGWMSAVVDVSAQRRVEELSRQQQERLQASARLATMGEMASLLSHELNQPLSAIASYATGSLNLVDSPDEQTPQMLRQALQRIAEQAERAGRVIKSVHDFVRRREQHHEPIAVDRLVEAVLPLMRLQARKSGCRIELQLPKPVPAVRCDRTMVEQVLLNLARNGIQAMETVPLEQRVLVVAVEWSAQRRVTFSVIDAGVGIAPEVAGRLFTPFFTTRAEGMGLGLSLCRTVVEQHGGTLGFESPWPAGASGGACFRFTLPAALEARRSGTPPVASDP